MSHLNCKTETFSAQKYDVFISYSHKDEARYIIMISDVLYK